MILGVSNSILSRILSFSYALLTSIFYDDSNMQFFGISLLNIILWAASGLIVGLMVHGLDSAGVKGRATGTVLAGIVGAFIGGFLAVLLFQIQPINFTIEGLLSAAAGGFLLSFVYKSFFRSPSNIKTTTTQLR